MILMDNGHRARELRSAGPLIPLGQFLILVYKGPDIFLESDEARDGLVDNLEQADDLFLEALAITFGSFGIQPLEKFIVLAT